MPQWPPVRPIVQAGEPGNRARRHVAKRDHQCEFGHGDLEAGFAKADLVIEHTFKTEATHQGYIEPHACLASIGADGKADMWCCTQGHCYMRSVCAAFRAWMPARLRVTASEIGGGFGGKTTVFIEPVALALSRKAGRPVKIVMTRDEVFRATGPTVSSSMDVKIGMKKDGTHHGRRGDLRYSGGAFPCGTVEWARALPLPAMTLQRCTP